MCATLFLSLLASALAQTTPAGWKIVKDSKSVCQIAVPPDWDPLSENTGAAVFQDATTAIAAVTSQAGQAFKPLPETWQKLLGIRKGKLADWYRMTRTVKPRRRPPSKSCISSRRND
jgi:hypothetical protein